MVSPFEKTPRKTRRKPRGGGNPEHAGASDANPTRVLVTFLGPTLYQPVIYSWHQHRYQTHLFPLALVEWFAPERVVLLLTPEVEKSPNASEFLKETAARNLHTQRLIIPSGKGEDELWEIFERLTDVYLFRSEEEVIFDITHAFRSLTMVVFLILLYLQTVRPVKNFRVLYGAFEAKDENDTAPVFELTPLLDLIAWIRAADRFMALGDARELGRLIQETNDNIHRRATQSRGECPVHLQNHAAQLKALTSALFLNRIQEVQDAGKKLWENRRLVEREVRRWVRPYQLLLDPVLQSVEPFLKDLPDLEREILRWLDERGHIYPAVLLMREHLVGLWGRRRNLSREEAEDELNVRDCRPDWSPEEKEVWRLWQGVRKLRNDLAHCGYRKNSTEPLKLRKVEKRFRKYLRRLEGISGF